MQGDHGDQGGQSDQGGRRTVLRIIAVVCVLIVGVMAYGTWLRGLTRPQQPSGAPAQESFMTLDAASRVDWAQFAPGLARPDARTQLEQAKQGAMAGPCRADRLQGEFVQSDQAMGTARAQFAVRNLDVSPCSLPAQPHFAVSRDGVDLHLRNAAKETDLSIYEPGKPVTPLPDDAAPALNLPAQGEASFFVEWKVSQQIDAASQQRVTITLPDIGDVHQPADGMTPADDESFVTADADAAVYVSPWNGVLDQIGVARRESLQAQNQAQRNAPADAIQSDGSIDAALLPDAPVCSPANLRYDVGANADAPSGSDASYLSVRATVANVGVSTCALSVKAQLADDRGAPPLTLASAGAAPIDDGDGVYADSSGSGSYARDDDYVLAPYTAMAYAARIDCARASPSAAKTRGSSKPTLRLPVDAVPACPAR